MIMYWKARKVTEKEKKINVHGNNLFNTDITVKCSNIKLIDGFCCISYFFFFLRDRFGYPTSEIVRLDLISQCWLLTYYLLQGLALIVSIEKLVLLISR